jgi:hypothetical protein
MSRLPPTASTIASDHAPWGPEYPASIGSSQSAIDQDHFDGSDVMDHPKLVFLRQEGEMELPLLEQQMERRHDAQLNQIMEAIQEIKEQGEHNEKALRYIVAYFKPLNNLMEKVVACVSPPATATSRPRLRRWLRGEAHKREAASQASEK